MKLLGIALAGATLALSPVLVAAPALAQNDVLGQVQRFFNGPNNDQNAYEQGRLDQQRREEAQREEWRREHANNYYPDQRRYGPQYSENYGPRYANPPVYNPPPYNGPYNNNGYYPR